MQLECHSTLFEAEGCNWLPGWWIQQEIRKPLLCGKQRYVGNVLVLFDITCLCHLNWCSVYYYSLHNLSRFAAFFYSKSAKLNQEGSDYESSTEKPCIKMYTETSAGTRWQRLPIDRELAMVKRACSWEFEFLCRHFCPPNWLCTLPTCSRLQWLLMQQCQSRFQVNPQLREMFCRRYLMISSGCHAGSIQRWNEGSLFRNVVNRRLVRIHCASYLLERYALFWPSPWVACCRCWDIRARRETCNYRSNNAWLVESNWKIG